MSNKLFFVVVAWLFCFACSQSPTQTKVIQEVELSPFTICNVMAGQTVDVYYGHFAGPHAYPDSVLFSISVGECKPATVADGTVLVYTIGIVHYANIAHKGEYWNL